MKLIVLPGGQVRAVYDETLDLGCLGPQRISRASHVEPDELGRWTADLSPVGGPRLGPFASRSQALRAELAWLDHWLSATGSRLLATFPTNNQ